MFHFPLISAWRHLRTKSTSSAAHRISSTANNLIHNSNNNPNQIAQSHESNAMDLPAPFIDWTMRPTLYLYYAAQFLAGCIFFTLSFHLWLRVELHYQRKRTNEEDGILIDSGASMHICDDQSKLLNYRAFHFPKATHVIGGTSWLLGIGDMEIATKLKYSNNLTRQGTLYLPGVLYMPNCGVTLL